MKAKCPYCDDGCDKCEDGYIEVSVHIEKAYTIKCIDCEGENGCRLAGPGLPPLPERPDIPCIDCGSYNVFYLDMGRQQEPPNR